jgi:hypothetical protein
VVARDDIRVNEYARSPVCCTPDTAPGRPNTIVYENGLKLSGIEVNPNPAGDGLSMFVAWDDSDQVPVDTYSVGLHVLDSENHLVAQTDYGLPTESFICQPQQVDLSAVPPGDYTLMTVVYNWRTGERIPGTLVETGTHGELIAVADFTVGLDDAVAVEGQ